MNMNLYKGKKVLITGGAGFIGSNLAHALIKLGADVTIIDSLIEGQGGNMFNLEPIKNWIKFHKVDLREKDKVVKIVKDKEICFNLAGSLSHIDSMNIPVNDLEINCHSQLSFLEACRIASPEIKIVFAGTRNQYGRAKKLPVKETHVIKPIDINGIHCQAAEEYHRLYGEIYNIKFCSLRMVNTFGPRHQMRHAKQGVLNWFIRQLIDREEIQLYGGGTQIRDTNYIDDVIEALLLAGASKKVWGEVYNLGGMHISLKDFVEECIKVNGFGEYKIVAFPPERKAIEVGDFIADWKKFHKVTGWTPKSILKDGIKETTEYYIKNKDHYW